MLSARKDVSTLPRLFSGMSFLLLSCDRGLDGIAAVMANVMGAVKTSARRSTRKVLADKTNSTPVAGLVPNKSPKKGRTAVAQIKEEARTPCQKMESLDQLPGTPVLRGEDLLRSLVHSNLSIIETPNGLASDSPEAETPQFGVPHEHEKAAAATTEVSSPQDEVSDASHENVHIA